ncbi:MAG: hypothetical protein ACJ788_04365 [Ktedonobacteraceae bacterium]
MSEQEMKSQGKNYTDPSISFPHIEGERYNANYSFEKLNPQSPQHKPGFVKRLLLALFSLGFLLLAFVFIPFFANKMFQSYTEYSIILHLVFYSLSLLLIIAIITINVVYNLRR